MGVLLKLVGSLIVRNEADRYQPWLAGHMLTYCDELWVLDDGSNDGTGELLRELGPEVKLMRNEHSRWDSLGEGVARQQLLMWTLSAAADWVLQLDGDEVVPKGGRLRGLLTALGAEWPVVSLRMVEVWERDEHEWRYRVDGEWAPRESPLCWRTPEWPITADEAWRRGYSIPLVPLACGREPEVVRMLDSCPTGLDVLHLGWSEPDERQARYDRYMRIDGGQHHASAHLRSILKPPELRVYEGVLPGF